MFSTAATTWSWGDYLLNLHHLVLGDYLLNLHHLVLGDYLLDLNLFLGTSKQKPATSKQEPGKKNNMPLIIGGSVVGVILLAIMVFFLIKQLKKN